MKIYIFKTVYIQIYCFETYYTLNGLNYYIWVSGKWYKGIGYNPQNPSSKNPSPKSQAPNLGFGVWNLRFWAIPYTSIPFCIHKMRKFIPFAV